MSLQERGILRTAIMGFLRQKPLRFAELKALARVHETALTITIRDLNNQGAIKQGYLSADGEWVDDCFPDEGEFAVAWRIAK